MLARRYRGEVLQLIVVRGARRPLLKITSVGEGAKDVHGCKRARRVLIAVVVPVLKANLVYRLGANHLRVADLDCVLGLAGVVRLGGERELLDSLVQVPVVPELVAKGQNIVVAELIVNPWTEIGPSLRVEHCLVERDLREAGAEDYSTHDGGILDVPAKYVEEERRFLVNGTTDVPVVELGMIRRFLDREGVPGVERRGIAIGKGLAVKLAEAGLRGDFDAAVAELVVFGGERILVDPNLQDRVLGRELAAGEAVNINLPAVRSRSRPGECLEFSLQLVRIIRE